MKKVISILLCVTFVLLCGCVFKKNDQNEAETSNVNKESITADSDSKQTGEVNKSTVLPEKVSGQFDAISKKYRCSGVQVAVIEDGKVAYSYEYGYANKGKDVPLRQNHKYRCASLSKLIAALTTMAVCENSDFDIDADVGNYLGYSVRNKLYPNQIITPRMLMTHTSSIIDNSAFLDSRNSASSVELKTLLSKDTSYDKTVPGEHYSYSNFGVAVLAAAVESYKGEYFDNLAKQYLFEKLGLDCGYVSKDISDPSMIANLYLPDGSIGYSAESLQKDSYSKKIGQTHHIYQGNLIISAVDYAKLLCVLINDGKNGNDTIVSKSTVDEILKPQASTGSWDCGLCIDILTGVVPGRKLHSHDGINFGMFSSFVFDKNAKNGVVILTSGADAKLVNSGVYNICEEIIRICYSDILDGGVDTVKKTIE